MRIVINADDFGHSDDTVAATIECFEKGALTSASFMVNMPGTPKALAYAKAHPEFSFGVHLTFVSDGLERPLTNPAEIPDLVTAEGQFQESNHVRKLALLRRLPVDQIEREATAQIAFLRDFGIAVSHVDSHGHTHKFAPFREALRRVLPRFGITRVRNAQDTYLRPQFKSPTYWLGGFWRRLLMARFDTTQHFFMPQNHEDFCALLLARLHGQLRGDSIEVGVHPGFADGWRAQQRIAIQEFAPRAAAAGHTLIGWKNL